MHALMKRSHSLTARRCRAIGHAFLAPRTHGEAAAGRDLVEPGLPPLGAISPRGGLRRGCARLILELARVV